MALRSVLAQRGDPAHRVTATVTLTAEGGVGQIRVVAGRQEAQVGELAGLDHTALDAAAAAAEEACTMPAILRHTVPVSVVASCAFARAPAGRSGESRGPHG